MTFRHGFSNALRPLRHMRIFTSSSHHVIRIRNLSSEGNTFRQQSAELSPLSAKIRSLMRSTPHSLTAIVSYIPSLESRSLRSDLVRGLLVSSFNTVTLLPKPHVSFNIRRLSGTYDAMRKSGTFFASGLSDATVANAFVKNDGDMSSWQQLLDEGRLRDGNCATWWMECEVTRHKCIEVGDHVVIVAEVLRADWYKESEGEKMGLVYAEGKYRTVGQAVRIHDGSQNQ